MLFVDVELSNPLDSPSLLPPPTSLLFPLYPLDPPISHVPPALPALFCLVYLLFTLNPSTPLLNQPLLLHDMSLDQSTGPE